MELSHFEFHSHTHLKRCEVLSPRWKDTPKGIKLEPRWQGHGNVVPEPKISGVHIGTHPHSHTAIEVRVVFPATKGRRGQRQEEVW